jgi:hypothetical protein
MPPSAAPAAAPAKLQAGVFAPRWTTETMRSANPVRRPVALGPGPVACNEVVHRQTSLELRRNDGHHKDVLRRRNRPRLQSQILRRPAQL